MLKIHELFKAEGIRLESTPKPGGAYVSVNERSHVAYVAIQFPILNDQYLYRGKLGSDLTSEQGYKAARLCAMNMLAQVHKYVGLERVEGLNHIDIYYQCVESWDDGPVVANGASELFVEALESKGRHSRAIFAVAALPRNFSVGVTGSFTLMK